jgi:hypothetical protein
MLSEKDRVTVCREMPVDGFALNLLSAEVTGHEVC